MTINRTTITLINIINFSAWLVYLAALINVSWWILAIGTTALPFGFMAGRAAAQGKAAFGAVRMSATATYILPLLIFPAAAIYLVPCWLISMVSITLIQDSPDIRAVLH